MYTLKRDKRVWKFNSFQNIVYKMDGNSIYDFPPKVGAGIIVYNEGSIAYEHWRTTIIKNVEKISDNEYNFETENSNYNIKKDGI